MSIMRSVTKVLALTVFSLAVLCAQMTTSSAGPIPTNSAATNEDGKYFDKAGDPTYNIMEDGTVDWYTYSGFRRYHSECHVCHGPDAAGSTYAPPLKDSLDAMTYGKFLEVVATGIEKVTASQTSKMPALADNKNVFCYIDDLYIYLKARADGVLPRGRPKKREPKPETAKEYEVSCHE